MAGHILMTGAAGRVGSVLAADLEAIGWRVSRTDIADGNGIVGADILDTARMAELCTGMDGVIHLAGIPNADAGWAATAAANVEGTRSMLEAACAAGIGRFVFASSIHVAGGHPIDTALKAGLELCPSGLYGASKVAAEALVRVWCLKTPLTGVIVRICTFAPKPRNVRELKTWLAPRDAAHLFDRALQAPVEGCVAVWGVSENARAARRDPPADAIGYEPSCDAENYAAEVAATTGEDPSGLGAWSTLGGRMTDLRDVPERPRR